MNTASFARISGNAPRTGLKVSHDAVNILLAAFGYPLAPMKSKTSHAHKVKNGWSADIKE